MRRVAWLPLLILTLYGCSSLQVEPNAASDDSGCIGTTALPPELASKFEAANDPELLGEVLGVAGKGGLCQGQVYASRADSEVVLFRAWNSTNPSSKLGHWWAFHEPSGKVAAYRADYEICYQWSPLDMLVRCTLKPGVKVVVGTGQSAECSQYLSYSTSDQQQIYIDNASAAVMDCVVFDGEFSWKPVQ